MLDTIASHIPNDPDYPPRVRRLDLLGRVLDNTLYDVLPHPFHQERNTAGEYVSLRDRRPSVRYPICRLLVEDSVSMLFGESRFPQVWCQSDGLRDALTLATEAMDLPGVLSLAALRGSVGSVAILYRVLRDRPFANVIDTRWLTPEWDPLEPDRLTRVTERYKVRGQALLDRGLAVPPQRASEVFWFRREWSTEAETWFVPQSVDDAANGKPPAPDPERAVPHGLGFVPIVWIRNLSGGEDPDGQSTFGQAVETSIEIDYQLSQAGRGLKYSADPLLLIKEPAAPGEDLVRSAGNAMVVAADGDAKMLEINGSAAGAVTDYVRVLREYALESMHGNRASADRLTAAQSGRAIELLHGPLISLVDRLRLSYGAAYLELLQMVMRSRVRYRLKAFGAELPAMPIERLRLDWPPFFPATHHDRQVTAQTLRMLRDAGVMSQETAVTAVAHEWDGIDPATELAKVKQDETAAFERAGQIKSAQTLPD